MKKTAGFRARAFTMLELLMVLTIMGVLMAIGMAVYSRVQQTALRKAAEIEMKQFAIASLNYKLDKGIFPESVKVLLNEGYINRNLSLDPWNQEYRIEFDDTTGLLKVRSSGPDKKPGTKDDITAEENL